MAETSRLGQRIANLRRARGLTQKALGVRLGVSPQTISNWENEVSHVPSPDLPDLARALGVSVADLYDGAAGTLSRIDQTRDSPSTRESFFNVRGRVEELRTPGARRLPIFRWGSAGDPRDRESAPDPDREEYPPAGRESLVGQNGFGVEVRGQSMVGRNIHDGDIVWVNPDRPPRLSGVVVALVSDGQGESGMVVKTWGRSDVGEGLLSETTEGRTPVLCREFKVIGPVVLVERVFPPT